MNEITTFTYNMNRVRTVFKEGEPWFVLKDVCEILDIGNSRMVAERLDDDEKNSVSITDGNRGNPNFTVISESGLYNVIFLSRKPEAKKFKKWVTSEVLPSIRKTGSYVQTPKTYIQALEALIETEREKERLKIELDESKKYFSVKRVAKINGISWKSLNWKKLKNTSQAMELEVKKVFDANYGNVNVYHIDVWKHEYPHLNYAE